MTLANKRKVGSSVVGIKYSLILLWSRMVGSFLCMHMHTIF